MPKENQDGQEKSEQPTSRRKSKSRSEGQVAQSRELSSFAVLLGGISTLVIFGGWMLQRIMSMISSVYLHLSDFTVDTSNLGGYVAQATGWWLITVSPVLIVVVVVGVSIGLMQFGFLWSTKTMQFKFDKLNPFAKGMSGFKKLFDQRAAVRLLINLVKVTAIGFVSFKVVKRSFPKFMSLADSTVGAIYIFLLKTILEVAIWTLVLLLVIAIIDFIYQKWKSMQELKMTKTEVKDERKMSEGDPKVKSKIRQMQFQLAFNTMIKELPTADVVVTNPVHVAVALKYDPELMSAPKVVGKGKRILAERIKKIAREHEIPIIENPPLARSLFKACEIGEEIPGQFFQDVAEILAYIYQLREELIEA
ncbi:MAG: flagellar biosynthesis protein FlhB [Candidatus Electryonea clarkiae]|nr:flagellar biosynthesis protein FlhB [Candidatus Electryonea clarkiae]MDP8287158.1 flagellar biosynthesis protein FlhB [Candidatus Electryonea clarkiae]